MSRHFNNIILSLFFVLQLAGLSFAQTTIITGYVTYTSDGDTIKMIPDHPATGIKTNKHGEISIRLYGIDAPETKKPQWPAQPYSQKAKDYLARLVNSKSASCELKDIDRYERAVCIVSVDGVVVNLEMVDSGYAWAYTEYLSRPYMSVYINAETAARSERRGLWQDYNPIAPWIYRKQHRTINNGRGG